MNIKLVWERDGLYPAYCESIQQKRRPIVGKRQSPSAGGVVFVAPYAPYHFDKKTVHQAVTEV